MAGQTIPDFTAQLAQCSIYSCRKTAYCINLKGFWICYSCLENATEKLRSAVLRDKTAASRGAL